MPSSTIKSYLDTWLKRKKTESGVRTHERYGTAIKHILSFLGSKMERNLVHFNSQEIAQMRDWLATKLSPNSANFTLKVLRVVLNQARREGFVETNEATRVDLIKRTTRLERRPFTMPELQRILANANSEWHGMILIGLYTGLRLGDICKLTWNNVNLHTQEIVLVSEKTKRPLVIPIAKPLLTHLLSLPMCDNPSAPVFPKVYEARIRNQHGGGVSNQFYAILVSAGLAVPRTHQSTGKGKDSKRQLNELSFHSLRHTATSLLKNAGVSDVVARDIIGHESEAVSRNYTHIDMATKRKAVDSMPDILNHNPGQPNPGDNKG